MAALLFQMLLPSSSSWPGGQLCATPHTVRLGHFAWGTTPWK